MTRKASICRPASSAIAAFLALSTPAAFAQSAPADVASPAPVADPVMMSPVGPAPAPAPVMMSPVAPQPTQPAPVIRVPLEIEPAPAPVAAAPARPAAAPTERPSRRVAAAPAAPAAATATAATVAPDAAVARVPETDMAPIAPVTDAAPLPAEPVVASDAFPWEIAGGAAVLLIVGGAGVAFARRRRSRGTPAPAVYESTPFPVAPTRTPRSDDLPQPRTSPAFAAAPSGSMGRHEALALAGPSAENPFRTLSKRLKRARFHDRHERIAYAALLDGQQERSRQPASAWDIANRAAPAPTEQAVHRPEPALRGTGRLRPGFAGS